MHVNPNAIFDPITNSEDEMIMRAGIKKGQACLYLRAYIIIRLLFSREFVISDSSINLNRALRTLILREEGGLKGYDYRMLADADFAQLIENGTIRLAARDSCRGHFSESLRKVQSDKKHVDLPSEKYTELIDGICSEENIYWWNAKRVSEMFTKKVRDGLEDQYSDEINAFLQSLSYRLRDEEILTYNSVINEVRKSHGPATEEYQIVRGLLRKAYDSNVPEILHLDHSKFFENSPKLMKQHFELNQVEQYEIPWPYTFDLHVFALLPANLLEEVWEQSEFIRYETAMSQYKSGLGSFGTVLDALEKYLQFLQRYIDRHGVPLYNSQKYVADRPKNIIVRFQEYIDSRHPLIVATEVGVWGKNLIDTACDLFSEPSVSKSLKLALTVMLPNIILKGYERCTALPKIEHGIMKLDQTLTPQ